MKNLLLIFFTLAFLGCKEDGATFDVMIPPEDISFRAIAGGAVMYYKLPADRDVYAINVRYDDVFGNGVLCSGSYACDSVTLVGFNEAQRGVRALVTLCDRNNAESAPVEVFFDTEDSGPVAFFDNVEVLSGWYGFIVTYDAPEDARGIAHIFYVGENPLTKESDTLLVRSFPIKAGKETISIHQKQEKSANDIVIRTEDFRGYTVMQKVWQGIEALEPVKLEYPAFDFEDPEKLSLEDPDWGIGSQYLFDGNTKGFLYAPATKFGIYLAGPNCLERTLFIADLHEPKTIAGVRFYCMSNIVRELPVEWASGSLPYPFPYFGVFGDNVESGLSNMLPRHITVYGSIDRNTWVEIGSFEDGPQSSKDSWWCFRAIGISWSDAIENSAEYDAADPCYLEIAVPPREGFRYIKAVFHNFYESNKWYPNIGNYVYLQELEIYTAKD